jgi:hypothetical protein
MDGTDLELKRWVAVAKIALLAHRGVVADPELQAIFRLKDLYTPLEIAADLGIDEETFQRFCKRYPEELAPVVRDPIDNTELRDPHQVRAWWRGRARPGRKRKDEESE